MKVKNNVKKLREEKELSQVELAAKMRVSRQTIHAIEKEKYSPSLELALKLAAFFEKAIEMIFYLEEVKK